MDSSAWLEYLADGPNATYFAPAIEAPQDLIVPTISLYEVFKRVLQQRSENEALQAVALMQQGEVVSLDGPLALAAARLGLDARLPLADAIMLATARRYAAVLWTQDEDFEGMPDVRFRARRK